MNEPGLNPSLSLGIGPASAVATVALAFGGLAMLVVAACWTARNRPDRVAGSGGRRSGSEPRRPVPAGRVVDFVPIGPIVLNLADLAVVTGLVTIAWMANHATPPGTEPDLTPHLTRREVTT